jgi:DNA-binding XRE family transcriptional regulator
MAKKRKHNQWALKLKAMRLQRDVTQRQAAETAGIPLRTWIAWENSQQVPSEFVRKQLASIFLELG